MIGYPRNRRLNYVEDGTASRPFLIKNVADFLSFRNAIRNGNNLSGIYHKLVNNIDLTGVTFDTLVGNDEYRGYFDGNFKIIRNYTAMLNNLRDGWGHSLIAERVYGFGWIKRLGVENLSLTRTITASIASSAFGVANLSDNAIIEQCYITGMITTGSPTYPFRIGGFSSFNANNAIIRNCWSNVLFTGIGSTETGGILASSVDNNIVENCLCLGNINHSGSSPIGGVTGYSLGNAVRNSVAAMSSLQSSNANRGRVTGYSNRNYLNNYALDTITINGSIVSNGATTNNNGANATIAQLKSKAFYRDVMGWDMENIWTIDEGNDFPKLKGF
jgi:hypothetical protein